MNRALTNYDDINQLTAILPIYVWRIQPNNPEFPVLGHRLSPGLMEVCCNKIMMKNES